MTYRQQIEFAVPNKSSPDSAMWIEWSAKSEGKREAKIKNSSSEQNEGQISIDSLINELIQASEMKSK